MRAPAGLRVLVVNAGSTSVKLRVLDGRDELVAGRDLPATAVCAAAVADLLTEAGGVDAVGHRVVHGGPRHHRAAVLTPALRAERYE